MAGITFFAELRVDPAQREAFDELMIQHARGALAEEKGTLAFDLYVDRTDPNRYAIYELFADQAAYDIHMASARLERWLKATDSMILSTRVWPIGEEIDPSLLPHLSGKQT